MFRCSAFLACFHTYKAQHVLQSAQLKTVLINRISDTALNGFYFVSEPKSVTWSNASNWAFCACACVTAHLESRLGGSVGRPVSLSCIRPRAQRCLHRWHKTIICLNVQMYCALRPSLASTPFAPCERRAVCARKSLSGLEPVVRGSHLISLLTCSDEIGGSFGGPRDPNGILVIN